VTNVYQFINNSSYVHANHLVKFGADVRFTQQNAFRDVESRGRLQFSPFLTLTNNALADLLLGFPLVTSVARVDNPQQIRTHSFNFFINDSYRITLAVAGFRPDDIEVVAQQNQLTVTGKRAEDDGNGEYLHRGIAARAFERRFQLADFIEAGNARFENGLLSIALKRVVPEAMKPRKIEIGGSTTTNDRIEAPKDEALEAA